MDMLLKDMQEMDKYVQQPIQAPSVINEVAKLNQDQLQWAPTVPKTDESLAEVRGPTFGFFNIFHIFF